MMCCIETTFRLLLKLLKLVSYGIWRTFVSLHFNCLNLEFFFFCAFFLPAMCDEALVLCVPDCLPCCPIYVRQLFLRFERMFFFMTIKEGCNILEDDLEGWVWLIDIMLRLSWLQLIAFVNWMAVPFDSLILHFMSLRKLWLAKLYFTCVWLGYLRMCLFFVVMAYRSQAQDLSKVGFWVQSCWKYFCLGYVYYWKWFFW